MQLSTVCLDSVLDDRVRIVYALGILTDRLEAEKYLCICRKEDNRLHISEWSRGTRRKRPPHHRAMSSGHRQSRLKSSPTDYIALRYVRAASPGQRLSKKKINPSLVFRFIVAIDA